MNRRSDSQGLRAIRRFLLEGPHPLALAPEGQVTYHNHAVGPMESGAARLGLWCVEELERQGRGEEVLLLPLAIRYRYPRDPDGILEAVLRRIAARTGLDLPASTGGYESLITLTEQLVCRMEAFYRRFYPQHPGIVEGGTLQERIRGVCETALQVPEHFMGLPGEGDLLSRVFAVRQKGWDYLFRADLPPRERRVPLERVLADRIADEAYLHLRHNELVDVLEYLRTEYIAPDASGNRLIEYALNFADVVNRLMGGDIGHRYSPPHKRVEVRIGEPLKLRALRPRLPGGTRDQAEGLMALLRERLGSLSLEP
jgi:hypothetical protein